MQISSTLIRGIKSRWDQSNLDDFFTNLRSTTSTLPVLYDTEARPTVPFPYCIFQQGDGRTISRMSGAGDASLQETIEHQGNEIRQVEASFSVYAKEKTHCETLINKINDSFGKNYGPIFTGHLLTQYVMDQAVRIFDKEWKWEIIFNLFYDASTVLEPVE